MPELWQLKYIESRAKQSIQTKENGLQLSSLHLFSLPEWHHLCPRHVTSLDISHNRFQQLPDCLFSLIHLQNLNAQNNRLVHLSDGIRHFTDLRVLNVSRNHINVLPKALCDLNQLEIVNLSGNLLKELAKEIFYLPNLKTFHVTRNPIQNIPRDVYIEGLLAIQRFFNINIEIETKTAEIETSSSIVQSFCEQLKNLQLRKADVPICLGTPECQKLDPAGWDANVLVTSDYASLTGSSQENRSSANLLDNECTNSCYGDHGSEICEDIIINGATEELTDLCEICFLPLSEEPYIDDDVYYTGRLDNRCKFMVYRKVAVIIPEHNLNHYMHSQFSMKILSDIRFHPEIDDHTSLASHIVSLAPHRVQFYRDKPARIKLPLFVQSVCNDNVICMRSNTDEDEIPIWLQLPITDYNVFKNYVEINVEHFSLYTVLVNDYAIRVTQDISSKAGGCLEVPSIPALSIDFPKGTLEKDITVTAKVYLSELPAHLRHCLNLEDAAASPFIFVAPHGCKFRSDAADPVTVRLPLPHYAQITQTFGSEARLTILSTDTTEAETSKWTKLDIDYTVELDKDGNYVATFSVPHFTGFGLWWEKLTTQLNQRRIGLSFFYPNREVTMTCQAFMTVEDTDSNDKFALLIVCHCAGNTLQDFGNYARHIGGSIKPVSIQPGGNIEVRLAKSDYFEADTGAGEDATLIQTEKNFRGNEFEKQFACKFIKGSHFTRGVFGKVFVTQKKEEGSEIPLFQFNLIKNSDEPDQSCQDPWSLQPLKELAEMHGILNDDNWKVFSRELGFTEQEILKFSQAAEPFVRLVSTFKVRGGTHNLFSQTMSEVARKLRLGNAGPLDGQPSSSSWWSSFFNQSQSSSSSSSPARNSSPVDEEQAGPSGYRARSLRKRRHPTCEATAGAPRSKKSYQGESSSDEQFVNLQISPPDGTPPRTPPRSPLYNTIPSMPPFSSFARSSPPLASVSQMTGNVTVVGSHTRSRMSCMPIESRIAGNAPNTSAFYATVASSSSTPATPMPVRFDKQLQRQNREELTHRQIYRIAVNTQTHWRKIARYVRDDDQIENDIKNITTEHCSTEDQATQMMLKWKNEYTDTCTKGRLYSALCDIRQNALADQCMLICATE